MQRILKVAVFVFMLSFGLIINNQAIAKTQDKLPAKLSFSSVIKKVAPAVVSIYASTNADQDKDTLGDKEVYNHLFGNDDDNTYSIGSGVIISATGLLITNAHVVEGRNNITVVLDDGREYKAQAIHIDPSIDLALLKISDKEDFNYLDLFDKDTSEVGDVVLAIGNPFGIGQTVTSGIISGFRYFEDNKEVGFGKLIQIDAGINPGNSGGALVNSMGELIGINSAIYSFRQKSFSNIGFAIPSSVVKLFVNRALSGGNLKKYWIGLKGLTVDNPIANKLHLKYPRGVYVDQIFTGGPADVAGLKKGDVIVQINDTAIDTMADLSFFLAKIDDPSELKVTIIRNKRQISLNLTPAIPKETPKRELYTIDSGVLQGTTVANNSPAVSYEINSDAMTKGVVIYQLNGDGSLLGKLKSYIHVGDFLTQIGDTPINTTADVKEYIATHPNNSYKLTLKRGDEIVEINLNYYSQGKM